MVLSDGRGNSEPPGGEFSSERAGASTARRQRPQKQKRPTRVGRVTAVWWRGQDSNLRPLGYEPNELPLLHPAAITCN